MSKYPECEKLSKVHKESQIIGEFLDWCNTNEIRLATYHEKWGLVSDHRSIEKVLADYYDIDLNKVEEEKRHILEMEGEIHYSMDLLGVFS